MLDADTCYRALSARDARFDGLFFVGVSTTGVYCRPVCTARLPRRERCSFFPSAALAEQQGYRACFRCRPELAPGSSAVDSLSRLVAGGVTRIDAGFLNEHSVDALAADLGVTARHLRRAFDAELGVSPGELAQTRRLALAKQLLHDTRLSLADVAFSSGFGSVRRFNAAFAQRFGRPPSQLRARSAGASSSLDLRLGYRLPFDFSALLTFIAPRAIAPVEVVDGGSYRRAVRMGDDAGVITVTDDPVRRSLVVSVPVELAAHTMAVAARVRALFDLDAEAQRIGEHLSRDRRLASLVARRPGLRVLGAFDPFETTVRVIVGQQISVRGATTITSRIAQRFGTELPEGYRVFPAPERLARASVGRIASLGMPSRRAESIRSVAQVFAKGHLSPGRSAQDWVSELTRVPGIGAWTAHTVAMRALGWPDAFPSGDLGLKKALGEKRGERIEARAENWRPWRAYAAMHLWASL